MDFDRLEQRVAAAARRRVKQTVAMREAALAAVPDHQYAAEPDATRRRAANDRDIANISGMAHAAEAKKGPRNNFIPVSFLEAGALAARSVARVSMFGGSRTGTGFLISPNLFITNHHVLPTPEHAAVTEIEFEFEADLSGRHRPQTTFRLDAQRCFVFSDVDLLDYTVVAMGERVSGPRHLQDFGYCPLSSSSIKHAIGEFANIIQHPDGRAKEVVLQDNLIAARQDVALHYLADTEPGSSGSPVFNNRWQVIALHHWGEIKEPDPENDTVAPDAVNEGIRISRIVADLSEQIPILPSHAAGLVSEALHLGKQGAPNTSLTPDPAPGGEAGMVHRANPDGTITWQVPVEITVGIGGITQPSGPPTVEAPQAPAIATDPQRPFGPEARSLEELVASKGYDTGFLPGFDIPLPDISLNVATELFPQYQKPGRPPYELTYTHFSVVMHKARKLAMLTACNIDGKTVFGLTRDSGERYLYTSTSRAISARLGKEAAESSGWFFDDRIPKSAQTGAAYYDRGDNNELISPKDQGFKPVRNFDRGHLVRRLDPVWGTMEQGLAADADSHAWTNVGPQTPQFNAHNKDKADIAPGEEKRVWAALENTILRSAHEDKQRITVFGGPVFSDDDPVYAGLPDGEYSRQVPLEYWKVAVWVGEDGDLKSLALRVSQRATMLGTGAEALDSDASLLALNDYLTTIPKLEDDLGFRFPDVVREADIRRGRQGEEAGPMSAQEIEERLGLT